MITKRDASVIAFVDMIKIAKTSTISRLFYPSYTVAARRLSEIVRQGELARNRDGWSSEYVYYRRKPKQIRHAITLSDFYRELSNQAEIKKFIVEPTLGDIRPDAVVGFVADGKERIALVEIELSNKGFDYHKYAAFNWQKFFPAQPELIIVSNQHIRNTGYKTLAVKLDMQFHV